MAAVVRVKRRIDEEPLNAFILNCKKRKIDETEADQDRENLFETKDEISTILKFAGTVETQDENINTQITKLSKDEAKQLAFKSRKPNITEKNRQEMRQAIQDNRFKVVNCFRSIQNGDSNDRDLNNESIPKEITVVDIEKQTEPLVTSPLLSSSSAQNQQPASTSSQNFDDFYVYDLYLPETDDQMNMNVDYNDTSYLSVRPFDNLVYEDRYSDNDYESLNSEDSNAEDNWRNDYPDEIDESVSDSGRRRNVYEFDEDQELSTDDEDYYEGYVHSIKSNNEYYDCDDYDSSNEGSNPLGPRLKRNWYREEVISDDDSEDD